MAKQLSRLISSRGGRNPGNGAVRVSPGVYRQGPQQLPPQSQAAPIPRPAAGSMPQQPQAGIGGFMQNQMPQPMGQPQMQAPMPPWAAQQANPQDPNAQQQMAPQQGQQWIKG